MMPDEKLEGFQGRKSSKMKVEILTQKKASTKACYLKGLHHMFRHSKR